MLRRITVAILFVLLALPLLAQPKGKKGPQQKAEEAASAQPAVEGTDAEEPVEGADIPRVVPAFDPGPREFSDEPPINHFGPTGQRPLVQQGPPGVTTTETSAVAKMPSPFA